MLRLGKNWFFSNLFSKGNSPEKCFVTGAAVVIGGELNNIFD